MVSKAQFLSFAKSEFNYFGLIPYISSIESNYTYEGLEHSNSLKILAQKFNEFVLNKDEYWSINSYDENPHIIYQPENWNEYNIVKDNDYNKIEEDLKINGISLEDQFINYSGRWFFEEDELSEIARSKVSELKMNF